MPRINNREEKDDTALLYLEQPSRSQRATGAALYCSVTVEGATSLLSPLHSPALITNWSVIHHLQRCWGLTMVGVRVPFARTRESMCHFWIPVLSLYFISTFFFFFFSDVHTGRMWEEKKTQRNSEIDTQTEGDLIWSRFSFGEIENLILPPNQYSDPLTNYHMTLTNMNCFPFIWFLRKILA